MNIDDLLYVKKINGISHSNCNCKTDMINEMVDEYDEAYDNVVTRFEVLINTKSAIDVYVNDSETPIKALYYTKKKQGATTEREEGIQVFPNQIKQGDILRFSYNVTIPENLKHNETILGTYGVYYRNNSELAKTDEISIADLVSCLSVQ